MMSGMGPGAIRWPWASCAFVSLDRPPAVSRAEGIEAMGSSLSWKMMSLWALALSVACSPRPMPPGLELNVRIPMRDGVSLVADVATPGALQRSPVIVELTPYGRGLEGINYRNELEYWVTHGYAFVIVDKANRRVCSSSWPAKVRTRTTLLPGSVNSRGRMAVSVCAVRRIQVSINSTRRANGPRTSAASHQVPPPKGPWKMCPTRAVHYGLTGR